MSNRTILLIDYDPQSIESAIRPLTGAGFTVEVANDGVSGLQAFERLHPDLVLIEPMVPKKHGFEVCQEIKGSELGRSVPVLITTGFYRGRKHQLEAKQFYGCDEYLEKPIAEDLLVSTCQKYLDDDSDEPLLLEDLEADAPATASVLEEAPPELDELSEEEIVARLDDLIKEDPGLFAEESAGAAPAAAPEAPDGDASRSEPEPPAPAESLLPVPEPAAVEPPSAEQSPGPPEKEEALALGSPAEVTYGAPGTGAEAPDVLPTPQEEIAAVEERPSSSSRRLWIVAAAAGLLVAVGAGIVLGPRLLRGDDAAPVASAPAARSFPAATPATVPEPVAEELAGSPDAPPAAVDGASAEAATGEGPATSSDGPARPAAVPAGRDQRSSQPASRPEPEQPAPEPRATAPRQAAAQPSPPPARSTTTETTATSTAREEPPASTRAEEPPEPAARQETDGQAGEAAESVPAPATTADPIPEPPTENAPTPRETAIGVAGDDAAAAAAESAEERSEPETAQPVPTPAPAAAEESEPAESAPAVPEESPRIERPKVARGTLLDLSEVDTTPEPLNKRPPDYPPLARRLRLEGTVSLRLLVDERGRVTAVETITRDAHVALTRAAEKAAREWTYRPATKDDVPVKVWIVEHLAFQR